MNKNSVLNFFEQIAKIPRNSGKESKIKDFLVDFATKRSLSFYADNFNNVIIYKNNCNCEKIILHSHIDMVCVKKPKSNFDFDKDGINLVYKNGYISAKETSLGADNGIGIAIILSLLDSDIPCNIEAVFTASEETTMQGAYNLDVKRLKGKKLICLDGFEKDTIMISSAGFVDFLAEFDNERIFLENNNQQKTFSIVVEGLLGGHSGFDIDKNRGSSHKLLAQLLLKIEDCQLIKFFGGHNFNVIPSKSQAVFTTTLPEHKLKNIVKYFYKQQKKQYKNLHIKISRQIDQSLVLKNGKEFLNFVINFSQGVLEKDGNNYVLSSQNIAEVDAEKGYLKIGIRSCNKQKEQEVVESLKGLCKNNNISFKVLDSQPAFNTLQNSILLQDLLSVANNNVKTTKCHIGVECGIFQDRIKNLDVVIVSPNIKDAHSVNERVEIQSIENLLNWLEKYLKKISQKAL